MTRQGQRREVQNRSSHKQCRLWTTLFCLLLFLANPSESFQLHRSIMNIFSSFGVAEEGPDLPDVSGTPEDLCEIAAPVGGYFNHSMGEEFVRRNFTLTEEHSIKVQIRDPIASDWLLNNDDLVLGVPLERHLAAPHYILATLFRGHEVALTIPCTINVTPHKVELKTKEKLRFVADGSDLNCLPTEPVVTMVISLRAQEDDVTSEARLRLIRDLCNFVAAPEVANRGTVTMETDKSTKNSDAFLSGRGNSHVEILNGLNLAWPVACGADSAQPPSLDTVERSAASGALAHALGYDVIEWRLENRKVQRAPVIAPKQTTGEPGDERSNAGRTPHGAKGKPQKRLKRAPVSTPGIYPQFAAANSLSGQPYKVAGVPNIRVPRCNYFEYQIAEDAFRDPEDGDARQLKLSLVDWDFQPMPNTWLLMDQATQTLYGVPPRDKADDGDAINKFFSVIAEDSSGQMVTASFSVDFASRPRPTNHRLTMYFSAFNSTILDSTLATVFGRTLSVGLEAPFTDVAPPGHFTVLKTEVNGNALTVTWFQNALGSRKKCDTSALTALWNRITGATMSTEASQRDKPTKNFAASFRPHFKLKAVKLSMFGPCDSPAPVAPVRPNIATMAPPIITPPPPKITPATTKKTTATTKVATTTTTTKKAMPSPPPITPPMKTTRKTTQATTTTTTTTRKPVTTTTTPKPTTTTTTRKPTTTPRKVPKLLDEEFTLVIPAEVGKVSFRKIPESKFASGSPGDPPLDFVLQPWGDGLPPWVAIEPSSRSIVVVPTLGDTDGLAALDPTHVVWKGGLVGKNELGAFSKRMMVDVRVALPPSGGENGEEKAANHAFVARIQNYVLENFTSVESARFLKVISDVFGDRDASSIYVYPPKAGSVIFSWSNTSLNSAEHCPSKKIMSLGNELSTQSHGLQQRFSAAGFKVSAIEIVRRNACNVTATPKPTPTPPKNPRVVPVNPETTTESIDSYFFGEDDYDDDGKGEEDNKDNGDDKPLEVAGGDGTTGIIIMIVVLVCVAFLIIVAVIKCRNSSTARRKRDDKKKLQSQAAAAAVIPPSSPYRLQGAHKNGSAFAATGGESTLHFKPGTPIVFDGEHDESTAPMLTTTFSQVRRDNNSRDDSTMAADEAQPLARHNGAGGDAGRPPPPAYSHK